MLTKWDAQWYGGIAGNGYGFVRTTADGRRLADYAFFPLFPWTERLVSVLTGLTVTAAGVLISAIASVVAAAGIFAVAERVLGRRAAVIATVLWSVGSDRSRRVDGVQRVVVHGPRGLGAVRDARPALDGGGRFLPARPA